MFDIHVLFIVSIENLAGFDLTNPVFENLVNKVKFTYISL
jgi:hypothetical protein